MRHAGPWWSIAPAPSEPPEDREQDELDEIIDEIWTSGVMLVEAIIGSDPMLTIEAAIRMHAEEIQKERRERDY